MKRVLLVTLTLLLWIAPPAYAEGPNWKCAPNCRRAILEPRPGKTQPLKRQGFIPLYQVGPTKNGKGKQ